MNILDKTFPTPSAFAEWVASRHKNDKGIIEPISGYDQVKLHFGEGNYYMEWDTIFRFNDCGEVSISGVGDSSSLYFKRDINFNWDDSVIMFEGTAEKPISVKISDIKIRFDAQPAVNNADLHELSENNIPGQRKIENWMAICQKVNMGIGKEEDKNGYETHLIKCYHAKSFVMTRVKTKLFRINCTSLDLRQCSNVDVHDCEFVNYNLCKTGGCVWVQGNAENISVCHNTFYKYGNDELFALWNSVENAGDAKESDVIQTQNNIRFQYNKVYYQSEANITQKTENNWNGACNIMINVYTNQGAMKWQDGSDIKISHVCYNTVANVKLSDNVVFVGAPVNRVFQMSFDRYTIYRNVEMANNRITYSDWAFDTESGQNAQLVDFGAEYGMVTQDVEGLIADSGDDTFCSEPIRIVGNVVTSDHKGLVDEMHACVDASGVKVQFVGNSIKCAVGDLGDGETAYARQGLTLLQSLNLSTKFLLKGNMCRGLKAIATLKPQVIKDKEGKFVRQRKGIFADIEAEENVFRGDTRIFVPRGDSGGNNMGRSVVSFKHNEILSDYPLFFLQGFADKGTALFSENYVERLTDRVKVDTITGCIYYDDNEAGEKDCQIRFIVENNVFPNITQNEDKLSYSNVFRYINCYDNIKLKRKGNCFENLCD